MSVKSTYNFVPAPNEKEVFLPDWADKVSHDIPFSDGESGEIELKITAETPIFIRNGHSKDQKENEFSHFVDAEDNKKYFIPATSLKGMFRNVLEIISSSHLNKKLVSDDRYAFRDLSTGSLYLKEYDTTNVYCGWLKEDENGEWYIEEHGNPIKISHQEIDNQLGTNFKLTFESEVFRGYQNFEESQNEFKFTIDGIPYNLSKRDYSLKNDKILKKLQSIYKTPKGKYNLLGNDYSPISYNGTSGILVLTGQAALKNYSIAEGKFNEFIFPENLSPNNIPVSFAQQKDFKFIYKEDDNNNISKSWDFWRSKLKNGKGVPVFYNKEGAKLLHFGLAYMYKLPFSNKIHDLSPIIDYKEGIDLTTLIYGHTTKENSLKGRVFISHSFCNDNPQDLSIQKEILASPKASFYPFYLQQFKNASPKEYFTYQDSDSKLRGFKRYPVHQKLDSRPIEQRYDRTQLNNPKIFSHFIPINKGAVFSGKIRFHNLKKSEIGALVSSITFHQHNNCFHSLGGVKPYGYGKVKVEIKNTKYLQNKLDDYLLAFEECMNWNDVKINRIKTFIAMASNNNDELLEYPSINDFRDYKNIKEKLDEFSIEKIIFKTIEERNRKIKSLESNAIVFTEETIVDLVKKVNEIYDLLDGQISLDIKKSIIDRIEFIYENHRVSKKRLKKPFEEEHIWRVEITKWFGSEEALSIYNELTNI